MATCWISETEEKVNYTKLCRLLYDGGTLAVRTVFDGIVPPASLAAQLATNEPSLRNLKKPKGKILNSKQWHQLYPPSGVSPTSKDFDVTLLFVLLRNICGLKKPPTGWDALPKSTDTTRVANLVRVKYYRNEVIAHSSKTEVDNALFATYWSDISNALAALGLKKDDIDKLKESPIGEKTYNQLVQEWFLSDQEIKSQFESLKADTSQMKTDLSQMKADASQSKQDTSEIKACTSNIDLRTSRMESDIGEIKERVKPKFSALDNLAFRDFNPTIHKLSGKCHPNTREWLLSDVKSRVSQDHSNAGIEVIQAGPGMGKSVVAAKLCQEYKSQGILGGCHFFKHDNSLLNNPRLMLQSVARQLCDVLPEYRDILERSLLRDLGKKITELTCKELWTLLFEEPGVKIKPDHYFVIIIDALDECCNRLKKELFIALEQTSTLPSWLRFVLTTRPPPSISSFQAISNPIVIDPKDSNNTNDLQMFMSDKLRELRHTLSSEDEDEIHVIIRMTKGLFLVAYFLVDYFKKTNTSSITEAVKQFPKVITSIYEDYFSRLREVILPHVYSEDGFHDMLEAVVTAKAPIEKMMFYSILGLKKEPRETIPKRERKEALNLLHQLFPIENDHVSAFHKTVVDCLTTGDHDFSVKGCDCIVLANKCYEVVRTIKQTQKQITTLDQLPHLTDCDIYALTYLSTYIYGSKDFSTERRIEMERDAYILCLQAFYDAYSFDEFPKPRDKIFLDICKLFYIQKSNPSKDVYPTFVQVLWYALRVLCLEFGETKEALDYFQEKGVPYIESKTVLSMNQNEHIRQVFTCSDGIIVVQRSITGNATILRKYQLDGSLVQEISLVGWRFFNKSHDDRLLVSNKDREIEVIDVASLEIIANFQSPSNLDIYKCYVFGCKPWYVALQCDDNKLYIMEIETGLLVGQPTALQSDDRIVVISKKGHILIANDTQRDHGTVEDGCVIIGRLQKSLSCDKDITIRARVCDCKDCGPLTCTYKNVCFSNDAELASISSIKYRGAITIIRTSDGSCYKSVQLCGYRGIMNDILFLSKTRIIITLGLLRGTSLLVVKFGEHQDSDAKLEHIFLLSNGYHSYEAFTVSEDHIKCLIRYKKNNMIFIDSISIPVIV